MTPHRTRRVAAAIAILFFLNVPRPTEAFFISVHEKITHSALGDLGEGQLSANQRDWIVQGSAAADLLEGGIFPLGDTTYDGRFHFDNDLDYAAVLANYRGTLLLIGGLVDSGAGDRATCINFGQLLHSIEDFYAHSNYLELYLEYNKTTSQEQILSLPTFEQVQLDTKRYGAFLRILKKSLRTGRYPNRWIPSLTDHGLPAPYSIGLNQDIFARPLFQRAQETATDAASWYLKVFAGDKTARKQWTQLKQRVGVAK